MARFIEPFDPRQPLVLAVLESPILLLSDQADVGSVNPGHQAGCEHRLVGPRGSGELLNANFTQSTEGRTYLCRVARRVAGRRIGASYSTWITSWERISPRSRHRAPRTAGVFASYPLVRSQDWNKRAFAGGDNDRTLGGAGIGLILEGNGNFSLHAYWADSTTGGPATVDSIMAAVHGYKQLNTFRTCRAEFTEASLLLTEFIGFDGRVINYLRMSGSPSVSARLTEVTMV